MIRNTPTEYGSFIKVIHWLTAAIILVLIMVGIYMADLPRVTEEEKQSVMQLYGMHKSFGVVVMLLVVLRLGWLLVNPSPALPAVFEGKERLLVESLKKLLYLLMIMLPISGYLMSNAGGHPIMLFGLFELPALIGEDKAIGGVAKAMHMLGGWAMLLVVLVHTAGALKHRLLEEKGSEKDILQRML